MASQASNEAVYYHGDGGRRSPEVDESDARLVALADSEGGG